MIQQFLNALLNKKWRGFRIIHHAQIPAQPARHGEPARPLPQAIRDALLQQSIPNLYHHQAVALDRIRSGKNVVVATPTSSGKSLVYNLAVTEGLLEDPALRALYLFPIKALSRDQLQTFRSFLKAVDGGSLFQCEIYDGDTTPHQRAKIRQKHPHVLITNPDMMHYALLPYHNKWEAFWKNLKFVVIDEMHTYRGIFGSHVAQILRRLQRVCRFYGGMPQFILLSATISNPQELAGQLIGADPEEIPIVCEHGAPQAKRHFVFLESEEEAGGSTSDMAARLIVKAAESGLKTIAFTQSRKLTELVHMSILRKAPMLGRRVSSYRAGFLPEERRGIEQKMLSGELAAVISTSALEMGIDIGGLDLCVLLGYPGTVMTTWQRGGRVGRSGQESAIVLLPQADALDQYIIHHPEQFLRSQVELAVTDPLNTEILKAHLPCAASELPLQLQEIENQPVEIRKVVDELTAAGRLRQTADGEQWLASTTNPQRYVDIRAVGASYAILMKPPQGSQERKMPLGKTEGLRAFKECHPGAIYLHRGESYQVESLDLLNRVILVTSSQVPYYTRVKSEKETEILETLASKPVGNFIIRLGRLRVTETILGYERRQLLTQGLLDTNPLDLPPQTFETVGFWMELEPILANNILKAKLHFMGGIHAVEHAAISLFPLFVLCDRNDIGGISTPHHPQVGKAAIFIYDGYPGGIGLAARGYELIDSLLLKTRELIESCSCLDGCPACIHSPKCGSGNKPLDKLGALATLRYLLGEWNLTDSSPDTQSSEPDVAPPLHSKPAGPAAPRIGFFDLETQRLADEVGGWQNKHLMRVSVAVVHETPSGTFHVYREEEVPALLKHLQALDLVVGFNISQFDYAVLKAYTPFDFNTLPTFDLLQEIYRGLGFRLSLNHLAEKTLGKLKASDGIQAVKWFREGQWDSLIHYCKLDVELTRDLFLHGLDKGYLLYEDRQNRVIRFPTLWNLETIVLQCNPDGKDISRRKVRIAPSPYNQAHRLGN